ncbi:MAG: hypothetical protein QHJ73_10765, partial [Armatimonadota bacterium]|nr:hypothetical protein [Armatimonadota bacterium]
IADQLLTRGRSSIGALFQGYSQFFTWVGFQILYGLAVTIGLFGFIVGGIFLGTALSLGWMEIVDRRAGAFEALAASWRATAGRRLAIFGNLLVLALILFGGFLALGVGIVLTFPVAYAGYAILYREVRGLQGAANR